MSCHSARTIDLTGLDIAGVGPGSGAFRLLNDYQQDFPLVPEPFAAIGEECGLGESDVLDTLQAWRTSGVVSHVGPVFAPRHVGASALAALCAPKGWLHVVAERVGEFAEVNHIYQRDHAFDLWFVITAASAQRLQEVVAAIEFDTGCRLIVLPIEEEFHSDLGVGLAGRPHSASCTVPAIPAPADEAACALPGLERRLMRVLQSGVPLVARPFEALGRSVELSEAMTIELIERWLADGIVQRFGVIVRHHELGFRANALCVWDVPDEEVGRIGRLLAAEPAVTLCDRRRRALPDWSYNLHCMIHGRTRDAVRATRDELARRLALDAWPHDVLFSTRRFKQQGASCLREDGP